MSYIRPSFYYDPYRQGYDTNSWNTITGSDPTVVDGTLWMQLGTEIAHYADFVKGDITMRITIPSAPGAGGGTRRYGVYALSADAYLLFSFGGTLTVIASDGVTTSTSEAINWDSSLNGVEARFRIVWDSGLAKFYINESNVATLSGASIPHGPLSLYANDDSADASQVGAIDVRGMQSYILNPNVTSTPNIFTGNLPLIRDTVTVSESVTILIPTLVPSLSESTTVSESITFNVLEHPNVNDAITVAEDIALTIV